MKRAMLFMLLAVSLTGCAVRARYYYGPDPYWRNHDRYEYRHDRDDRWR